jgi:hypothetical protein
MMSVRSDFAALSSMVKPRGLMDAMWTEVARSRRIPTPLVLAPCAPAFMPARGAGAAMTAS